MDILDRLYDMLSPYCTDAVISRGPRLTEAGLKKVAAALDCTPEEVSGHIANLAKRTATTLGESDIRFTYEEDATGSIMVRDTKTSDQKFLSGTDAAKIRERLKSGKETEQAVLSSVFMISEDVDPAAGMLAFTNEGGTYNFPYRDKIATVSYGVDSGVPRLEVVSLRDLSGNEVDMTPELKMALTARAVKWIPNV